MSCPRCGAEACGCACEVCGNMEWGEYWGPNCGASQYCDTQVTALIEALKKIRAYTTYANAEGEIHQLIDDVLRKVNPDSRGS